MRTSFFAIVLSLFASSIARAQVPPPPDLPLGEGEFVGWEVDLELLTTIDCPRRPPELNGPEVLRFEAPVVRNDPASLEGAEYVTTQFQYYQDSSFESAWPGVPGSDVPGSDSQINISPLWFDLGPYEGFPDFSSQSLQFSCPPGECPPFEVNYPFTANQPWLDAWWLPIPPLAPADPIIGTGSIEWGCEYTGGVLIPEYARQTNNFVFRWRGIYRAADEPLEVFIDGPEGTVEMKEWYDVPVTITNPSAAQKTALILAFDEGEIQSGSLESAWPLEYCNSIDGGLFENCPSGLELDCQIFANAAATIQFDPFESITFPCRAKQNWNWIERGSPLLVYEKTIANILAQPLNLLISLNNLVAILTDGQTELLDILAEQTLAPENFEYAITATDTEGATSEFIRTVVIEPSFEQQLGYANSRTAGYRATLVTAEAIRICSLSIGEPVLIPYCGRLAAEAATFLVTAHNLREIAVDPVVDYDVIAQPESIPLPGFAFEPGVEQELLESIESLRRIESFSDAAKLSFVRYQGAILLEDDKWTAIQREMYQQYTSFIESELGALKSVGEISNGEIEQPTDEDIAAISYSILSEGLPLQLSSELERLGLAEEEQNQIAGHFAENLPVIDSFLGNESEIKELVRSSYSLIVENTDSTQELEDISEFVNVAPRIRIGVGSWGFLWVRFRGDILDRIDPASVSLFGTVQPNSWKYLKLFGEDKLFVRFRWADISHFLTDNAINLIPITADDSSGTPFRPIVKEIRSISVGFSESLDAEDLEDD